MIITNMLPMGATECANEYPTILYLPYKVYMFTIHNFIGMSFLIGNHRTKNVVSLVPSDC